MSLCTTPSIFLPLSLQTTFLKDPVGAVAALAHSIPISWIRPTLGPDEALGLMTTH